MIYYADQEKRGVYPLNDEQYLLLFNIIKAVDLRMARAEDYPFLRQCFVYFSDPTDQSRPPAGIRVLDLLAFTVDEILSWDLPGVNVRTITKRLDQIQELYGKSTLPKRDPLSPIDPVFFGDNFYQVINKQLLVNKIGLPEQVQDGTIQNYVDYLETQIPSTEFQDLELQIAIAGGLTRKGMRLFKNSLDAKEGKLFWAGFEKTGDEAIDKENLLKLAALPDTMERVGAEKLGMVVYLQPKLLEPIEAVVLH